MSNYLGRCKEKGCGFAIFATPENVREGESFADVKPGCATRVGNNGVFGRCLDRHKFFPLKLVQGTYSNVHECDSRCLNAKGYSCTCSCGGANHGRGHATIVVEAAVSPPSAHLGEVGKFIKGEAVVVRKAYRDYQQVALRTPYHFRTDKGAIIVWWIPQFLEDPNFDKGQRVSFRAKVSSHDIYNGEAQTRISYLEEV